MKDIVVLVPGITGSVLQKDGKDIWNPPYQVLLSAIGETLRVHSGLKDLTLQEDDIERDYLDDGIKATGLVQRASLVPGFFKLIDGYSYIRDQLTENFAVTPGKVDEDKPANYFEFAYDWRRDNRVAARLLKKLIDKKLRIWRERMNPHAKVILIAHSMGGLVSRYYVEHEGGCKDCKLLVTLGTPYRGSVKILDYLANGYLKNSWLIDRLAALTHWREVLRSFTSVYQLLPTYPVVNIDGNWQRIAEIDGIPGVVKERAIEGRKFLKCIELPKNAGAYTFTPIIGIGQKDTFQSATFSNGLLKASNKLPNQENEESLLHPSYATGDDTVPLLSAIPKELSQTSQVSFIELHGSLQSSDHLWENSLKPCLIASQNPLHLEEYFNNPQTIESAPQKSGISLSVDDLYLRDEEVTLGAEIINVKSDILEETGNFGGLRAIITPVNVNGEQKTVVEYFDQKHDTQYKKILEPNKLLPGLYRLEVDAKDVHESAPNALHSLFQVME